MNPQKSVSRLGYVRKQRCDKVNHFHKQNPILSDFQIKLEKNKAQNEENKMQGKQKEDLIGGIKLVVHEAGDNAGFTNGLIAEEDELVFGERRNRRHEGNMAQEDRSKSKLGKGKFWRKEKSGWDMA